jgi:hypothetical protein
MSTTALQDVAPQATSPVARLAARDAGRDAYGMLRLAFAVAPIAFGVDKFLNVLTNWPHYWRRG